MVEEEERVLLTHMRSVKMSVGMMPLTVNGDGIGCALELRIGGEIAIKVSQSVRRTDGRTDNLMHVF